MPNKRVDPKVRFKEKTRELDNGCVVWTGKTNGLGYGKLFWEWDPLLKVRVFRYAHHLAYEWRYGAIPFGMVLDHLCRNPSCVNPEHLEPVTQQDNICAVQALRLTVSMDISTLKKLQVGIKGIVDIVKFVRTTDVEPYMLREEMSISSTY